MKRLMMSVFALCTIMGVSAQDQTFKKFKVDISAGYAIPGGSGSKGGVLFAIEPKYAINDLISLGLRMEGAAVARISGDNNTGTMDNADVKAAGSYLLTGDYYFNTNGLRPFVGAGVGIYSIASYSESSNSAAVDMGTTFGGMIRGGFETGHFRAALEYNLVASTNAYGFDNNGNAFPQKSKNGYIGIKIGFFLGGGRLDY